MNNKLIQNKNTFRFIGGIIGVTSFYWLYKTGYHLIFYSSTGGLENGVFGYPKDYSEIVIVFSFWLIIFVGGLGLIKGSKIGLISGLTAGILNSLFSFVFLIAISKRKLQYSTSISINGIDREMTLIEKWNIIYLEIFLYFLLFVAISLITFLIVKRLKINRQKHEVPAHNKELC